MRVRYEYPAKMLRIPLYVLGVWLLFGVIVFVAFTPTDHTPPLAERIALAAPFALLTLIALLGQWLYRRRFRPIEVTQEGLWIGGVEGGGRCIGWDQIERALWIRNPSGRKSFVPGRFGVALWAGGRVCFIYEQIDRFDELVRDVTEELAGRGVGLDRS